MRGISVFKRDCLAMFPWSSVYPQDHPLRAVRKLTDTGSWDAEPGVNRDLLYADSGRPFDCAGVALCEPCHMSGFYSSALGAAAG